jgi:hypothetical protein
MANPIRSIRLADVKPGMFTLFGVVLDVRHDGIRGQVRIETPDRTILDSDKATINVLRGSRLDEAGLVAVAAALREETP